MEALVLGCGEAFDQDLFNTSILVRTGHVNLLFDCGYAMPPRVWQAVSGPDEIDLVYISHAHADHYFGIPALLGRMWEDGRTKPLVILSQPAVLNQIKDAMELGYRGLSGRFRYPIDYRAAEPEVPAEACGTQFRFAETKHSVTNLAVRVEAGGKTVCYSGDGLYTGASKGLFRDADLLFHEAYSFEQMPVHGDIPGVLDLAAERSVKRLALVHIQRAVRRDREQMARIARPESVAVSVPEPGHIFTF